MHELFVVHYAVPGITLDLIANTTRLPNVAPYNTFSLTCTGTSSVNGRNVALPKRFQWLRWYGFSEFSLDLLSSNATIQIQNGDDLNQPTSSSVLTVTENISQNYHYRCRVDLDLPVDVIVNRTDVYPITITGKTNIQFQELSLHHEVLMLSNLALASILFNLFHLLL